MTLKKYQKIRIVSTIILAIIVSQSILFKNFIIPFIGMVIVALTLMYFRRQVKEIIADERDHINAGQSAVVAIQVYSWIAVTIMLLLYAFSDLNPSYMPVAQTLAYSTCALMFINSMVFKYQNKIKLNSNKTWFIVFAIILALFFGVLTIRLFSGEDNWVCQNNQWIQHGHPDFPAPTVPCK